MSFTCPRNTSGDAHLATQAPSRAGFLSNEATAEFPTGPFAGHLLTTAPPRQPGSYRTPIVLEARLSVERIAREKL